MLYAQLITGNASTCLFCINLHFEVTAFIHCVISMYYEAQAWTDVLLPLSLVSIMHHSKMVDQYDSVLQCIPVV